MQDVYLLAKKKNVKRGMKNKIQLYGKSKYYEHNELMNHPQYRNIAYIIRGKKY